MDTSEEVLEAARRRAEALASGDQSALLGLLHPSFRWFSHTGERFDRDSYVASSGSAPGRWDRQELTGAAVVAHESTAVLRCEVLDEVDHGEGVQELRMPSTQVWVRHEGHWVCLAGHAGPSLS